ncbi:uncharacterized protein EKO05_0002736 [Ascochyta rabiei]|uniref:uncharacterized protein n=1 Tax=Didymella rabiei TaxID=5454 RepID=UPI0021FDC9C8|nr:uncharacterized protein EKO05_0002736 [Ascochyta rabiei]UPX12170.1 hypothetical protein EKO05_0002736 [Ascochyta rabiei]
MFIAAHDYSWLITDPVVHYALVEADCMFPTPSCLRNAKVVHRHVIQEQLDHYWCTISEETAMLEHEKQVKDDHNRYIAEQVAKGDKWDRWEVGPPTIININNNFNNFINPTFVAFAFLSTCTTSPEIPGLDVELLAAEYCPTAASEISNIERAFSLQLILCVTISLGFISWMLFRIIRFFRSLIQYLSRTKASLLPRCDLPPPMPRTLTSRHYVTPKTSSWPPRTGNYSSLQDAISAAPAKNSAFLSPAAQVDDAPRERDDLSPSSPPTSQAPIRSLEPSTVNGTELAPSTAAEEEDEMCTIMDDMLTEWEAEASESPLEPSTGNVDISAPPVDQETAPSAVAEGGQLKRKIHPLRKRRGAAPQPAAPKLGGDQAE